MKLSNVDLQTQLTWYSRAQWSLLGAGALIVGGAYLFCIRPMNSQLEFTQKQYAAAKVELQHDQDRAKNIPVVDLEIQHLRSRVERFDKALPKEQDLAVFINDVTKISQDASLKKLAWHLDSKPRRSEQLTELPIQFTFEGDFQSGVLEFLRGTEDMRRLTRVRKLALKSTDARDGQVKAEVTMNIYFGEGS